MGWTNGRETFLHFIRSQRYELESGWLLLDKTVFPSFDSAVTSLALDVFGSSKTVDCIANGCETAMLCNKPCVVSRK